MGTDDDFINSVGSESRFQHIATPKSLYEFEQMIASFASIPGVADLWLSEDQCPRVKLYNEIIRVTSIRHKDIPKEVFKEWTKTITPNVWTGAIDAAYSVTRSDVAFRFRCNIYMQRGKLRVCMRLINSNVPHYKALGLPDSIVRECVTQTDGIGFFCGATGSGKSTSIAALLVERSMNREEHIVTLEDPIEYDFIDNRAFFSQRQLGQDFDSFEQGLKHAMRQAPNTLLVGEIRDTSTAEAALHAAETGHFVFTTMHTKRAPDAMDRFRLLFEPTQQEKMFALLSSLARFVVCQRLINSSDGKRVALLEVMHINAPSMLRPLIRQGKIGQLAGTISSAGYAENFLFEKHLEELRALRKITEQEFKAVKEELDADRTTL